MRHLAGLAAAFMLLSSSGLPAEAACPPLPPLNPTEQVLEATRVVAAGAPKVVTAISTVALRPLCRNDAKSVICVGAAGGKANPLLVQVVDTMLRSEFEYRIDELTAGESDVWRTGVLCGDCEDYALTLADRLVRAGVGGEFMWLALWDVPSGGAHATLLVQTTDDRVLEVSVGEGGRPVVYNPALGRRFAVIRLDGQRRVTPLPGYRNNIFGTAVEQVR